MVTFEDCLGLCGLTVARIAAIARHEHLPEILALELGAHLYTTAQGRQQIRQSSECDLAAARKRGDRHAADELDIVLQSLGAIARSRRRPGATSPGAGSRPRCHVRRASAGGSLPRGHGPPFRPGPGRLRKTHRLELLVADTRCAACRESERCGRFLAGTAQGDDPTLFCANAQLFLELGGGNSGHP